MPVIPIDKVVPLADTDQHFIDKMKKVLKKQGQIEPLQVHSFEDKFIVFQDDAWGNEIVFAARQLGWGSLLVHITNKFEE